LSPNCRRRRREPAASLLLRFPPPGKKEENLIPRGPRGCLFGAFCVVVVGPWAVLLGALPEVCWAERILWPAVFSFLYLKKIKISKI